MGERAEHGPIQLFGRVGQALQLQNVSQVIPVGAAQIVFEFRDPHRRNRRGQPLAAGAPPTGNVPVPVCILRRGDCACERVLRAEKKVITRRAMRRIVAGEQQPAGQQRIAVRAAPPGNQSELLPRCRKHRQRIGIAGVATVVVFDVQCTTKLVRQEQIGIERGRHVAFVEAGDDQGRRIVQRQFQPAQHVRWRHGPAAAGSSPRQPAGVRTAWPRCSPATASTPPGFADALQYVADLVAGGEDRRCRNS